MIEATSVKFVQTQTTAISAGLSKVVLMMLFFKVEFYEGVNALMCCACRWTLTPYAVYSSDKINPFNNHRFPVLPSLS